MGLVECPVNRSPVPGAEDQPSTTHSALRYLFNDLLPLKRDHVGRTLNCFLHLVLSTALTTCQVLGKHMLGELQSEESAEGMWSGEAAISSALQGMAVRKVIFLGSLRQVSGEECDDGWS